MMSVPADDIGRIPNLHSFIFAIIITLAIIVKKCGVKTCSGRWMRYIMKPYFEILTQRNEKLLLVEKMVYVFASVVMKMYISGIVNAYH